MRPSLYRESRGSVEWRWEKIWSCHDDPRHQPLNSFWRRGVTQEPSSHGQHCEPLLDSGARHLSPPTDPLRTHAPASRSSQSRGGTSSSCPLGAVSSRRAQSPKRCRPAVANDPTVAAHSASMSGWPSSSTAIDEATLPPAAAPAAAAAAMHGGQRHKKGRETPPYRREQVGSSRGPCHMISTGRVAGAIQSIVNNSGFLYRLFHSRTKSASLDSHKYISSWLLCCHEPNFFLRGMVRIRGD